MSIAELKELIKDLPDDMPVVMPHGDETFITVCRDGAELVDFPIEDEEAEEGYSYVTTLVLHPCTCEVDDLPVVPQEQILN